MQLRVGCEFQYQSLSPTPALVLVQPHPDLPHSVVQEDWQLTPNIARHGYLDLFANRVERLTLPVGSSTLRYDAIVEVSRDPDPVALDAVEWGVQDLPDDVLVYTLASRYCMTESLSQVAWHLFGQAPAGWARVQAICDWIHDNIQYGLLRSTPLTTAVDVYVAGGGMCRDFAHLAITFCRCLNIPARYVFGYMPDIDVTGPQPAMDFHAWFEVWLGDRWWTFDARFNRPRIGRVPIGLGRDAVDVAMVTTYGAANFQSMVVWTDEINGPDGEKSVTDRPAQSPGTSEGLILGSTQDHRDQEAIPG